jgi:hypothetical protein
MLTSGNMLYGCVRSAGFPKGNGAPKALKAQISHAYTYAYAYHPAGTTQAEISACATVRANQWESPRAAPRRAPRGYHPGHDRGPTPRAQRSPWADRVEVTILREEYSPTSVPQDNMHAASEGGGNKTPRYRICFTTSTSRSEVDPEYSIHPNFEM